MYSLTEFEVGSKSKGGKATTEVQLSLKKSAFIKALKPPEKLAHFNTTRKKGSKFIIHHMDPAGHVVIDGKPQSQLSVFAGLVGGYVGDVSDHKVSQRKPLTDNEAFMPFILQDDFTMLSYGNHNRNGKEQIEIIAMTIPHRYVVDVPPLAVHIIDNLYHNKGSLIVRVDLEHPNLFPPDMYSFVDPVVKFAGTLVQLTMGTGSESLFYIKGTSKSMTTKECVDILSHSNEGFPLVFNEAGDVISALGGPGKVMLGKWLKETVKEVGEVSTSYSYRTKTISAVVVGNTYRVKMPMARPIKPEEGKRAGHDELVEWFWANKLTKASYDSLLLKGVASALDIKHLQGKEILHALKVRSDWAKTLLLAQSLTDAGMAGSLKVTEFVKLCGVVAGSSISGKNPMMIGMYPITIFDEAATLDKKVDAAFIDQLKIYGVMDVRGMNQKINTMIRGHQVLVLSRMGMSALDNVHDEVLNRLVRLSPVKDEVFPKEELNIDDVRHALTWYTYEQAMMYISELEHLGNREAEAYCNDKIFFDYTGIRELEKQRNESLKYGVICNIMRMGAREILDLANDGMEGVVDPNFRYHKDEYVIACHKGEIAFTAKSQVYNFASMNTSITTGLRDDIVEVMQDSVSRKSKSNGQISVYPLKISGSKSVGFVYQLDEEALLAGEIPDKLKDMDEDAIIARVAEMKGVITPLLWSYIALRLLELEVVYLNKDQGRLDDF